MKFEKNTLKNGLRIITAPQKETKAVTLLFLIGVGSRYEKPKENGISHFLEHILFKGTKKYPSPQILSSTLDGIGADFNAFTSEEYTGFWVSAASNHFDLITDVIHEMIYEPKFAQDDVKREKGVIVEEMNMYQDLPQYAVWDVLKNLLYGDSPLGRKTVGTKETVTKFQKKDFVNYQKSFYTPENVIVSIAGNQEDNDWLKSLTKLLNGKRGKKDREFEGIKQSQPGFQVKVGHKQTDQTHLLVSLPALRAQDDRRYILDVLKTVLGGGMSSRLFSEIREKRGLAYYVRAGVDSFHDTGNLVISSGVRNAAALQAVKVIINELKKLKNKKIPSSELKKAKEMLKGSLVLGLESSQEVANFLALQELYYGKLISPEEIIDKIEAVTSQEILGLANELFKHNLLSLAAIGPLKDEEFMNILQKSNL